MSPCNSKKFTIVRRRRTIIDMKTTLRLALVCLALHALVLTPARGFAEDAPISNAPAQTATDTANMQTMNFGEYMRHLIQDYVRRQISAPSTSPVHIAPLPSPQPTPPSKGIEPNPSAQ